MVQDEDMCRKCGVCSCGPGALLEPCFGFFSLRHLDDWWLLDYMSPQLLEASLGASRLICTGQIEWYLEVHGKEKVS